MDPQTSCRHGCAALLAERGGDHEAIQRAAAAILRDWQDRARGAA